MKKIFLKQPNNLIESTEHFVVHIISKLRGWTNQNFVDLTKSFSECEFKYTSNFKV